MGGQQAKEVKQKRAKNLQKGQISNLDYCILCKTYLTDKKNIGKKEVGAFLTDRRYVKIPNHLAGELYCGNCEGLLCVPGSQEQLCKSIRQLRKQGKVTKEDDELLKQIQGTRVGGRRTPKKTTGLSELERKVSDEMKSVKAKGLKFPPKPKQ